MQASGPTRGHLVSVDAPCPSTLQEATAVRELLLALIGAAVDASPLEPAARHHWIGSTRWGGEPDAMCLAPSTVEEGLQEDNRGVAERDSSAATGGACARGWRMRMDAGGRRQWQSTLDATVVVFEKPTVVAAGAMALAGNWKGTRDQPAIEQLIPLCGDVYAPHRALAAVCIAEVMRSAPRFAAKSEVVSVVLRLVRTEIRARVREAALAVLSVVAEEAADDGEVVRTLLLLLDDPDRRCRAQVCASLAMLGPHPGTAAADELVRLLAAAASEQDVWYAREAALDCLSALARKLQLRNYFSLQGVLWEKAWLVLTATAACDNEFLRAAALRALGECSPASEARALPLVAHLVGDGHQLVRDAALLAMSALGQQSGDIGPAPDTLTPVSTQAGPDVAAHDHLTGQASGGLVKILVQHVKSPDQGVRVSSVEAVALMVGLSQHLEDGNSRQRQTVGNNDNRSRTATSSGTDGLGGTGVDSIATRRWGILRQALDAAVLASVDETLAGALSDVSAQVRLAAANAVFQISSAAYTRVAHAVFACLETVDISVSPTFRPGQGLDVDGDGHIDKNELCQYLLRRHQTVSSSVEQAKVSGTVTKGKLQGLQFPGEEVRRIMADGGRSKGRPSTMTSAVRTLLEFTSEIRHTGVVVEFAKVEEPETRVAMLQSLAKLSPAGTASHNTAVGVCLLQLLDISAGVRAAAATALADMCSRGSRDAISAFVGLLSDTDSHVRAAAARGLLVLAHTDDEWTLKLLLPMLDGFDGESTNDSHLSRSAKALRMRAVHLCLSLSQSANILVKDSLEKLLAHPVEDVRDMAIQALVDMMDKDHDPATNRGHQAALTLVPLLEDAEWQVALTALRGIQRLQRNRLMSEMAAHAKGGSLAREVKGNRGVTGALPYASPITQALLRLIQRADQGSEALHAVALETLDQLCDKTDTALLEHLVRLLVHPHANVRRTSLAAVGVVVNGRGLSTDGDPEKAPPRSSMQPKPLDGADIGGGKFDAVVEACARFIQELTAQQRSCGKLQMEVLRIQIAMQKPGADKEALGGSLEAVEEELRALKLSEEETRVLGGRLQAVMDCLSSVVPIGNESAISCIISCLQDDSFQVRMCALSNLARVSGPENPLALANLVEMLSSPNTQTRWAAAEGLLLVGGKGNRELLSWLLLALDSKDILDPFVRQAIIGAVAGVLLQSDFPKIVAALGSEEDKARLALLLQEVDVLQVDYEKEQGIHSEEEIKALQERREEAARLRKNISEAKSQLGSASWLDAQHFWQVTQEVDFVNACQDRLNELETQLDSNTGAAWENLQAGLERIKNLAVKCMVAWSHMQAKCRWEFLRDFKNIIPKEGASARLKPYFERRRTSLEKCRVIASPDEPDYFQGLEVKIVKLHHAANQMALRA